MLSKLKSFTVIRDMGSRTALKMYKGNVHSINGMYCLFLNTFCNTAVLPEFGESINNPESPDLPSWVKFSEDKIIKNQEDDFVLPSISYWIENQNLHDQKAGAKSLVGDTANDDVDKISKILKKRFESPDPVVQALKGCSVIVSESLVTQMLKRFSKEWIPAFGFFKWAKLQTGFKHSPDSYNLMVDSLGKSRKFALMWEIVEEMHKLGYVTLVTMTKVMRRLAKAHRYEEAIEAFRRIEQFGVNKDVAALNTLMDALVKDQSSELAQSAYTEFKSHISPNLRTFNILIHGWCKARQLEKAQVTIEEMRKHGLCPDVVSYTSFIEAYCYEKDFRKVDAVLVEMQEKGCPQSIITYTIIMHALGKAKQINEALEVYEKMKHNGIVPDSSFYSSLIYILSKAGRLKDAQHLFDDMPKQGVTRNVWAYNTMITIACQHSQEEQALKLLKEMEDSLCKPDNDTYVPLLKMCCRMKRMKVISFLLNHMVKNDVGVGIETYSILVRGLCKSGKLEHACSFFEEIVLRGFVPWDNVYKLLVTELDRKGMGKAKEQIEELMVQAKQQGSGNS
ncbi:hypothetical protein LguiA_030950 [Lonicera macranthoides]